jgi:hypothetical protein
MPDYLSLSTGTEVGCQKLFEFAGRIVTLLESQKVRSSPSMQASLDDLLGAVYSLIYAEYHRFEKRSQSLSFQDVQAVTTRAKDISNHRVRTDGKWTAGFYYNNALFRISAVYHRALKIVTGREAEDGNVNAFRPAAEKLYKNWRKCVWSSTNLKKLHREVNQLKHTTKGIYEGRNVQFDEAVQALDELLKLIEAWR